MLCIKTYITNFAEPVYDQRYSDCDKTHKIQQLLHSRWFFNPNKQQKHMTKSKNKIEQKSPTLAAELFIKCFKKKKTVTTE